MAVPQFVGTSQSRYMKLLGAFAGLDGLAAILVWAFMRAPERAISLGDMNVSHTASSDRVKKVNLHSSSFCSVLPPRTTSPTRSRSAFLGSSREYHHYGTHERRTALMSGSDGVSALQRLKQKDLVKVLTKCIQKNSYFRLQIDDVVPFFSDFAFEFAFEPFLSASHFLLLILFLSDRC